MFFRLMMAVLWVACAEDLALELERNVGGGDAQVEPTPTPNNGNNTVVSISLNNLPKGVTTETSINVSVTSNDGAKSYRYVISAATGTDDGTAVCKAATYSGTRALSENIAESNLAVGKHRLCVKAENAAGQAEDYPTVFEWEIVSQLPSNSPCSPCTVGCSGWTYSSWTPSQALHCSTESVKQIAASIRTCDSQCSECSTGSTLTRTVDGTKNCSPPQTPSTPTCTSCSAGCTDWSYGAWTPSAANTCSDTQLTQTAAGTRTCDAECSQCNTSTSKTRSINGTKNCTTPTCASCAAGCTAWSYEAWTPSPATTCSDQQLQQTAAGKRTCDAECSQCSTSTSKSQIVAGTKSCPKHPVLVLPDYKTVLEKTKNYIKNQPKLFCHHYGKSQTVAPLEFLNTATPTFYVKHSSQTDDGRNYHYRYPANQETLLLTSHSTVSQAACNEIGLKSRYNLLDITRSTMVTASFCPSPGDKTTCCQGGWPFKGARGDLDQVEWRASEATCYITIKWRN